MPRTAQPPAPRGLGLRELRSAGQWHKSRITRGLHSSSPGRTVAHRATWPPPGRVPLCPARRARSRPLPLGQHTVSMYIQTLASGREQRCHACGPLQPIRPREAATGPDGRRGSRPRPTPDRPRQQRQSSPSPSEQQLHLLTRRAPPPAGPACAGSPASSSLEASVLPTGPAARDLPSPKATRRRREPAVHPNRLGWGLPLQRPAGASSAGPWRERGEANQSHRAREFNHAQRLRPAMKPTARARPWPAHCSEQRKGPEPGAAIAAWRHKAPREPREGVEAARPPPVGSEGPRRNNKATDTPSKADAATE